MSMGSYRLEYHYPLTDERLTPQQIACRAKESRWFEAHADRLTDAGATICALSLWGEKRIERVILTYETHGEVRSQTLSRDGFFRLTELL